MATPYVAESAQATPCVKRPPGRPERSLLLRFSHVAGALPSFGGILFEASVE
jgi:hypothetical protein